MARTHHSPSSKGNKQERMNPASSRYNRDEESSFTTTQQPPGRHGSNNFASKPTSIYLRYADHTYHDFSEYIEEGGKIEKHKKCDRNFPARLHAMLSDEQLSHIISWMPHGRAWKVLNKKLLVKEAIPKYFGHSKIASFTRQLSGWGFKRLRRAGPDCGCYYHECFLRGHPRLTILMRRVPPGQGRATPDTDAEPDFYLIAEQHPLEKSADMARKAAGKAAAAAPNMESRLSNHQRGYQRYSKPPPQPKPRPQLNAAQASAVALNWFNQPTNSIQYHSFASADVGTVAAKKKGDDEVNSSPQDVMNYDSFPVSNHLLHSHRGYSMHPAHQGADTNQYSGSNLNQQYAAHSLHQSAAGYYVSQPQQLSQQLSQQYNAQHSHIYYGYRHPYYSHYYNGQVPGQSQGQAGVKDQVQHKMSSLPLPAKRL